LIKKVVKRMPVKPKRPCSQPGCPRLTAEKFCEEHQKETTRAYSKSGQWNIKKLYGSRWRKVRLVYLSVHPLCVICKREGRLTAADVIDHVVPHRGDKILFWDESNWQSLCKSCHDRKTMTEDRYEIYRY